MNQQTSYRSLFTEPGYKQLYIARLVSSAAVWIDFTLIFSFLTFYLHATVEEIGVASALYGLPGLALGPLFGKLADKHSPFTLLYISYLIRGASSIALIYSSSIEIFTLIVFFKGIANLGVMPAEQVATRAIINKTHYAASASLMTITDQITKVTSPLFAAVAVQKSMGANIFWISACVCLIGIIFLVWLRVRIGTIIMDFVKMRKPALLADAVSFVASNKRLVICFNASLMASFILGFYDPFLAIFLKTHDFPPSTLGSIISCTAVGSIIGAVFFKRIYSDSDCISIIGSALIGFGSTVMAPLIILHIGMSLNILMLGLLWIINGACFALIAMTFAVSLQRESPAELIGTLSTSARSLQIGAMISAPLISAYIANITSIGTTFILSGTLAVVVGFFLHFMQNHSNTE